LPTPSHSYIRTLCKKDKSGREAAVTVAPDEVERRVDTLSQALRGAGLRLTHQRLEVVREIAQSDEHPDVEKVYRAVRARVPTISLDTVYRTLATLVDLGLVARVAATPSPARYDANTTRHHHFVCTRCGLICDVVDRELDAVRVPRSTSELGSVESIEVQLRGVCTDCARKEHEHD
jgi:Fur family transcriptional regulator, peroxide stress response regulator